MNKKIIFALFFIIIFSIATTAEAKTIFKIGKHALVEENVTVSNVITIGGQITVSGLVKNHVVAIGDSVVLTSKSVVRGNVLCIGGVVARGSDSQVFGKITEINSSNISSAFSSFFRNESGGWSAVLNVFFIYFQIIIFLLALLMALVFPRTLTALKKSIQKNKIKSFVWGLLITMMITPFVILLVISIIGIYLIPVFSIALVAALMLGYIVAATMLGDFTLSRTFSSYKKSPLKETILGLIILLVIGWVPYIGWLIKIIAITMGFGGVVLVMFSHKQYRQASSS